MRDPYLLVSRPARGARPCLFRIVDDGTAVKAIPRQSRAAIKAMHRRCSALAIVAALRYHPAHVHAFGDCQILPGPS